MVTTNYLEDLKRSQQDEFEIVWYEENLDDGMIELLNTNPEHAMSWWYDAFDNKLWYILPWQLILIWWVTWSWKSTFANQVWQNISNQWLKVGKFTLEDRHQDKKKQELYYELWKVRKKQWLKNYPMNLFMINWIEMDELQLQQARDNLVKKNKNILEIKKNSEKRINIDKLEWLVQQLVKQGCKLVIIDHLNEFELTWDKDRNDLKIEEVMYKLKDIWRRYNIAIILIAHYKKLWKDTKPNDESFKDSIAIAQVANKVIHLYRDKLEEDWITEVIITKNRDNPRWTWTLELNYDYDLWTYTNIKSKRQIEKESNYF